MYTIAKEEAPTFDFQLPGEKKVHSVPLLTNLPVSKIKKMREFITAGDNAEDTTFDFLDFMGEIFGAELVDSLSLAQNEFLFQAWQQASTGSNDDGETLGE